MALLSYALTTLDRVKLAIGETTNTNDTLLEQFINRATDYFEARTGRRFAETTYTDELYDGKGDKLFLREYPVTELLAANFSRRTGGTISSPTYTQVDADTYVKRLNAGFVQFLYGHAPTVSNAVVPDVASNTNVELFKVTYKAGYVIDFATLANNTLPLDIEDFVVRLVTGRFNRRKGAGIITETVEGASITWADPTTSDLTEDDNAVIKKYERKIVTNIL
jgi:hypothetical protein